MRIPRVQSCGCFDLKTVGLMIGFLQVFFHSVIILLQMMSELYFIIPISLTALIMDILWIYGIQKKKVILMLPSLLFPVLVSLVGLAVITSFPVLIAMMTLIPGGLSHFSGNLDTVAALGVWFASCFITAFFSYMTIVQYSLCKSLGESHRNHNQSRLSSATSSMHHHLLNN